MAKKKKKKKKEEENNQKPIQTLKGMHDVLPKERPYWDKVERVVTDVADFYGFEPVYTPIVEEAALFNRTLGEESDIVNKEMYSFTTKGRDKVVLRPEATASIARAYVQHGWAARQQPVKMYYQGPMFRYESPQAGRYRQFYQFGLEMLGEEDAVADAELTQIAYAMLQDMGIKEVICEVNTIGDADDREEYVSELEDYFKPHVKKQCKDCQRRYENNPLRMLDCKEDACQEFIERAPQIVDFVSDEAKEHFKTYLEFLDEAEIPYILNPHLVRGLDYYNRTVFEFYMRQDSLAAEVEEEEDSATTEEEDKEKEGDEDAEEKEEKEEQSSQRSAQSALIAGGRYDGLLKLLGAKEEVPAVGFAGGVERVIEAMKESKSRVGYKQPPKVFLVQLGELGRKKALAILEKFREENISVAESLGRHSIRSQMKIADKKEVELSLILGQKEALADEIIIRDMETGMQETVPMKKVVKEIKKRLKNK